MHRVVRKGRLRERGTCKVGCVWCRGTMKRSGVHCVGGRTPTHIQVERRNIHYRAQPLYTRGEMMDAPSTGWNNWHGRKRSDRKGEP